MGKHRIDSELLDELVSRTRNAPRGGARTIDREKEKLIWAQKIRAIRVQLKCSQREFADRYGIELRTLQNWEQMGRLPDNTSRALITLIEKDPHYVQKTLAASKSREPEMA